MKVVINVCFGGFSLSDAAVHRYAEIKGITLYPEKDSFGYTYFTVPEAERVADIPRALWHNMTQEARIAHNVAYSKQVLYDRKIPRDDPALVQVVEEMGEKADGMCAKLRVVEIPDGVPWHIEEYDGNEHVAEDHRTWL